MKNKELFDKTIGILVKAYFDNTLMHGTCYACAVGNLVCAGMGYKLGGMKQRGQWNGGHAGPYWNNVFVTNPSTMLQIFDIDANEGRAKRQIDSTGYSAKELASIEFAFETAPFGNNESDYMFNGLMAVCDALMQIHEANETEIAEAKALFVTA